MASSTSLAFFTCLWIFLLTSEGLHPQQITVKPGEDVLLQCRDPRGAAIKLLEWTRLDLDKDVFVWRNGNLLEKDQYESFRGRVKLKDPEMKDEDISVILKSVTINDNGTYECRARNNNHDTPQLISTITLTVNDSGHTVGHTEDGVSKDEGDKEERNRKKGGENSDGHLGPVICVSLLIVLLLVAYMILKKCKRHEKKNSDVGPPDEAADQQLT